MTTRQERMNAIIQQRRREVLVWYRQRHGNEPLPELPEAAGGLLVGCQTFHVSSDTETK